MINGHAQKSGGGELVRSAAKEINKNVLCSDCAGMRVWSTVEVAGKPPFPSWVRSSINYGPTTNPGGTADEKEAIEYALGSACSGKDASAHPGDFRDHSRYLTYTIDRSGTLSELENTGVIDSGEIWTWDTHTGDLVYHYIWCFDRLLGAGSAQTYEYEYTVDTATGIATETTTGTALYNSFPNLDSINATNQERLDDWHDGQAYAVYSASAASASIHIVKDVEVRDPPDDPDRSYDSHYDVTVTVTMSDAWSQEQASWLAYSLLNAIILTDTATVHDWSNTADSAIAWDTDMTLAWDMTASTVTASAVGRHVVKTKESGWPPAASELDYATGRLILLTGSQWTADCIKSRNCQADSIADGMCLVDFQQTPSAPFAQYGKSGTTDTGNDPNFNSGVYSCGPSYPQNAYWSRTYEWGRGMILRPDCLNVYSDSTYDSCCGWAEAP